VRAALMRNSQINCIVSVLVLAREALPEVCAKTFPVMILFHKTLKVSRNRPGVARRVPGDLGSQIFMTFAT
jgi:hypothetical protein